MSTDWTQERTDRAAGTFLKEHGLDEPQPELIRFYMNAVYRLPNNGLSLRLYGPEESSKRARLMVAFARFLEAQDFPAVRLSKRFTAQPFEIDGLQTSVWDWLDRDEPHAWTYRDFGAALRRLHGISDGFDYPTDDLYPLRKIRMRLDRLAAKRSLRRDQLAILETAYAKAADLLPRLMASKLGAGVLHGDALKGNSVMSGGRMHLIDFDSVCRGPREWDLAGVLATKRFGLSDDDGDDFLAGYGVGRSDLSDVEAAMVIKQLSMTVVLCLRAGASDAVGREIAKRLRHWQHWDFDAPWGNPFR